RSNTRASFWALRIPRFSFFRRSARTGKKLEGVGRPYPLQSPRQRPAESSNEGFNSSARACRVPDAQRLICSLPLARTAPVVQSQITTGGFHSRMFSMSLTRRLFCVAALTAAVFTRAYSQAPLTPTSHATILTGTSPPYHKVLTFPIPLGKDIPYMPDILKAHGYSTAA